MITQEDIFANKIFLNSVLPLVKVVIESKENIKKKFKGINAIVQISAKNTNEKVGIHFLIDDGEWTVVKGVTEGPTIELEFKSIPEFNAFFSGKSKKLPKIKGWYNVKLLINTLKALTTMGNLLKLTSPPDDEEEKELFVKLYFYLLSSGISQLNKAGHPDVSKWAKKSPERVYAWVVDGKPEISAYIKVKSGKTKAVRGIYKRSKPFFTMRFDSVDSALGILLERDDMIESTTKGKLIMEGGPEYGTQLGEFMILVGSYAK
ncbi:hypothetical protein [Paramaledivibacter caminithermalis]|jgi:uncharacterized protein (DUF1330 family)|uniref:SCP-2 sterol transfer family protein n=1 Tax=Paramaledivibacter caminithermalis (strain DSM 15212 / CIP 107654 / DViRD3) TaxID=1121301 RepID=A0A1M6QVJ1_PARC5|nr:hypothetical protein [Paramaledivibacter caminithermalis]SHK24279.1 hypothetical protein SAMN02745912_02748 [Paramaledivibacter caminithermalis DSM 15212]